MKGVYFICLLLCLLAFAPRQGQAQTEKVLHNFCDQPNCADGDAPDAGLISDSAGNLYGTTVAGGSGQFYCGGTVFEISPKENGSWKEKVLYSFGAEPDCADGSAAIAPVTFDGAGNLYGTTFSGGLSGCEGLGCGVVYKLSPAGGSWTETVLYSFAGGTEGGEPYGGVILDAAGNLYGGNSAGVYELTPSGGGWSEQLIYENGGMGFNELTMDAAGNIFGVSLTTAFELSRNGSAGWNSTVIYTFEDGAYPNGTLLLDKTGNLYGTTYHGGAFNFGTVYKLSYSKKKGWTEKILYSFKGSPEDGMAPMGIVFDAAGNIFGNTGVGGKYESGTIFELVRVGDDRYDEKVVWKFGRDGQSPPGSPTLDSAGNLYGTAEGGWRGYGIVFEVTP
jgi:uncharacterized repeat protein (TIGR03803 family)